MASRMADLLLGTPVRNAMPCCNSRVSHASRVLGLPRSADHGACAKSRSASSTAPSSHSVLVSSGLCAVLPAACRASQSNSNDAGRASLSHSSRTTPSSATAERILGSSGTSAMSRSRWPLCGSRSSGRLSRSQRLPGNPPPPPPPLSLPGGRSPGAKCIQSAGAERRQCADCSQSLEYALPAEHHRDPCDAVAGEHGPQIADAIDDAGGDRAGLLATEVQRDGTSQIRIGPEQAEGDGPDRDQG